MADYSVRGLGVIVHSIIAASHVREEERHLSSRYYPLYFGLGGDALQKQFEVDAYSLKDRGAGFVMVEMEHLRFLCKIAPNQEVDICSRFLPYPHKGLSRIHQHHEIQIGSQIMATCETAHAFVNLKTGKAIPPPDWFIEKLRKEGLVKPD